MEKTFAMIKPDGVQRSLVGNIIARYVALVLEGKNAVEEVRKINGATNPLNAACGTIRGDFGQEVGRNVVHASDSVDSAAREIAIYFNADEVLEYDYLPNKWLFE